MALTPLLEAAVLIALSLLSLLLGKRLFWLFAGIVGFALGLWLMGFINQDVLRVVAGVIVGLILGGLSRFLGKWAIRIVENLPERQIPGDEQDIVSPADGKVIIVDEVADEDLGPAKRVAVFMNVFDVHVNRAPGAGSVVSSEHHRGRFLAAFKEEADKANERQATVLETEDGRRFKVVQIAGILARRIISTVKPGDRLARGQRIGMICFGSRVDLYLPPKCSIMIKVGDRVKAGASIVGRWL